MRNETVLAQSLNGGALLLNCAPCVHGLMKDIKGFIEKENLYTAESPVNRGFTALLRKDGVCLVFKYM